MIAEDLNQPTNRVDLDPSVTDRFGLPAARVTYNPHAHEIAAQEFYIPIIIDMVKAAGADRAGAIAQSGSSESPSPTGDDAPVGYHSMGGMRCGTDAAASVTDAHGRLWHLQNVGVADGGVFPTSGGHNPTLTIMATALRNAWAWGGGEGIPTVAELRGGAKSGSAGDEMPGDDGGLPIALLAAGGAAVVAAGGAAAVRHQRQKGEAARVDETPD
jgi:hypothetical protein